MGHAYRSLFGHLVFHVKTGRILTSDLQVVHAYMCSVLADLGGRSITIGGIEDHVHILAEFPFDAMGDTVRTLKTKTTRWLKHRSGAYANFSWQRGYGLFSVSRSLVPKATSYVLEQRRHHAKISSPDEFQTLLRLHDLEFHPEWE